MLRYLSSIFKRSTDGNDVHKAVLGSIENQLDTLNDDIDQLKNELAIDTADSVWLDKWGEWFGVTRKVGESDDDYRQRIIGALQNEKVTIPAIIEMTKLVLGEDTLVQIYEPYHNLRIFDISSFSQDGAFQDGSYYTTAVFDLIVNKPITDELIFVINLIKAAGVTPYFTYNASDGTVIDMESSVDAGPSGEVDLLVVSKKDGIILENFGGVFDGAEPFATRSGDQVLWARRVSSDSLDNVYDFLYPPQNIDGVIVVDYT